VLLVRGPTGGPATLFCFCAIKGQFLGSMGLGTFDSDWSEVESVTVRTAFPTVVL